MVLGYEGHGKDTVCELLSELYNLRFQSTSMFIAEHVMMPAFGEKYKTAKECFEDRVHHRAFWYEEIAKYNCLDKTRLIKEIFKTNDIYCGLRNRQELMEARHQKLYDVCIWVDACARGLPIESNDSCTVPMFDADIIIDNSGSKEDLILRVKHAVKHLF